MSEKNKITLDITGMTCDVCKRHVSEALNSVAGVDEVNIKDWQSGKANVLGDKSVNEKQLIKAVKKAGYGAKILDRNEITAKSDIIVGNGSTQHLLIIGGGSAAFAAAIQAHELGAKVTMINDGLPIGGTCVNVGCVPSKNLIRSAETLYRATHNPFPGIKTDGQLTNFKELIEQKHDLVLDLRQQKYINVVKDMDNFHQIKGRARITSPTSVEVNGETIQGDYILIATGARPMIPDLPGLKEVLYLTNEEAFDLDELPKSIIVLGGRYIALEIAQMFARLGSKVTVLQRSNRILPTETADLTDALTGYLQDEDINIVTGNHLQRVGEQDGMIEVESTVNGESRTFKSEKIIIATGRRPNTNNMGLEENGVELNNAGFIKVNDNLQTSVPTIFAAGDVLGENMFVYTAAYEGNLAASNAFSSTKKKRDYTALPWVIFTDPQVAGVGLDEIQAQNKGIDAEAAVLPLEHVPRALAARDTRGFIKLIRDRQSDKLIGARILAPEGSELLMEVAMGIKFGTTTEQIRKMFHPYLTLSECIKLAAITFNKNVEELSCCAT